MVETTDTETERAEIAGRAVRSLWEQGAVYGSLTMVAATAVGEVVADEMPGIEPETVEAVIKEYDRRDSPLIYWRSGLTTRWRTQVWDDPEDVRSFIETTLGAQAVPDDLRD